jgi:hypothetical protein
MGDLWTTLLPLALAGALVPIQIILTIFLLESPGRIRTAAAFVAGMTVLRLAQGIVFGFIVRGAGGSESTDGTGTVMAWFFVVLALALFAMAVRQLVADEDADAPPPKWLAMTRVITPGKAFLLGIGLLAIGAKFWVFTLSAVAAIGDADLGRGSSILTFIAFVTLTEILLLVVLGVSIVAPRQSRALLAEVSGWLERNNRYIVIGLGVVFGTWFLIKGLAGLGIV